jgi:hypothetical protein
MKLKQYEEIAVLEEGDDGAVVTVSGQSGASVLLGPAYLAHLQLIVSLAEIQLHSLEGKQDTSAIKLLFAEMKTLLLTHHEACNKYFGSDSHKTLEAAWEELRTLRKYINGL